MKLLIIEDSQRLRTTLVKALTRLGHAVDAAEDGEEGENLAAMSSYDVIVLDLMLPGQGGISLLKKWRQLGKNTPVLLLTALDSIEARVSGLSQGADDYLVKPFALEELAARLEVLTRRQHGMADSRTQVGPLEINFAAKTVRRGNEDISLTAREFALLEILARRPGQVFSREQLEARLYNEEASPLSNAVDAAVYALRKKLCLEGENTLIQTRRGLGYVLQA